MTRRTAARAAVLAALLQTPAQPKYGLEISKEAGRPTGSIYPILARLEAEGWLTSEWERIDPSAQGRPRRRLYTLTGIGATKAAAEFAEGPRSVGVLRPRAAT